MGIKFSGRDGEPLRRKQVQAASPAQENAARLIFEAVGQEVRQMSLADQMATASDLKKLSFDDLPLSRRRPWIRVAQTLFAGDDE